MNDKQIENDTIILLYGMALGAIATRLFDYFLTILSR